MLKVAMSKTETDKMLTVLGNTTRREIIQRLSQEASYPLELSADLQMHQQLITKHLKMMEKAEVVEVTKESSPYGPDRRMYSLAASVSLSIDFSPDLYNTRMFSLDEVSMSPKHEVAVDLRDRLSV